MRFVSISVRYLLIGLASLLGGALAMLAYYDFDPRPIPGRMWVAFIMGVVLANFIARWWSYRHPPYLTSEWYKRRAEKDVVEEDRAVGC